MPAPHLIGNVAIEVTAVLIWYPLGGLTIDAALAADASPALQQHLGEPVCKPRLTCEGTQTKKQTTLSYLVLASLLHPRRPRLRALQHVVCAPVYLRPCADIGEKNTRHAEEENTTLADALASGDTMTVI